MPAKPNALCRQKRKHSKTSVECIKMEDESFFSLAQRLMPSLINSPSFCACETMSIIVCCGDQDE